MKKILAFDTSSRACSVALLDQKRHQVAPMQQGHLILPMIDELLKSCDLTLADLDAIAYGAGPGSFTGLRIASAVAQALSLPHKTPIIPISSLAIIAESILAKTPQKNVFIALDARTEQLYISGYKKSSDGALFSLFPETVLTLSSPNLAIFENILPINANNWCGAGDGWLKYRDILSNYLGATPGLVLPDSLPEASAMLVLAEEKFKKGDWVTAAEALPHYHR